MPKYNTLLAEFAHAYRQFAGVSDAFDRAWILVHPDPDHVVLRMRSGVILKLHRRQWSVDSLGAVKMHLGLALCRGDFDEIRFDELPSSLIKKVAEIQAQIELWQEGFRDELPTQNEVDEL